MARDTQLDPQTFLRCLTLASQDLLHRLSRPALRIDEHVGVDIRRRLNIRVPQDIPHGREVDILINQQAGTGVPEIVKANGWQAGTFQDGFEGSHEVAGADWRPVFGGKNQSMVLPALRGCEALLELPNAVRSQVSQECGGQGQDATAACRLQWRDVRLPLHR